MNKTVVAGEGARRLISFLREEPELYYAVAKQIGETKIFGPWKSYNDKVWECKSVCGETISARYVKIGFDSPTDIESSPHVEAWKFYSSLTSPGNVESFASYKEAIRAAETYFKSNFDVSMCPYE